MVAGPAGAIVTEVAGTTVGLQPRSVTKPVDGNGPTASSFDNAAGEPVLHGSKVFVLYWDPADLYHGDWQGHIDEFMQAFGSESGNLGNVFAVQTQYTDKSNVPATYGDTFRGGYTDTSPYRRRAAATPLTLRLSHVSPTTRSRNSCRAMSPPMASPRGWVTSTTCSPRLT